MKLLILCSLTAFASLQAAPDPKIDTDPFAPFLDWTAPKILGELEGPTQTGPDIVVREILFESRDHTQIFCVIASPARPGPHPGMLVLHGGGGSAEVEKACAWAQRGFIAVAPDLPGIADPGKIPLSKGRWSAQKYGEGRWNAEPDGSSSVIFDAVLSAMKALYLLESQPGIDREHVGVVGVSWGGYMTTMVCALAGPRVRAGFSIFGCGYYDLTAQGNTTLARMAPAERERWLRDLDPGRRAAGIKAAFFIAGATNDFFYYPQAVQATLDDIPGEKNHLYAPNANHKAAVPGGTVFPKTAPKPFKATPFQSLPTPEGNRANWLAMEVPYFAYYLQGEGKMLPRITVDPPSPSLMARFAVVAPLPITTAEVYWARADPDVMKRSWTLAKVRSTGSDRYEAELPAEAVDWFASVSDDRPVTVSSNLVHMATASNQAPSTIDSQPAVK